MEGTRNLALGLACLACLGTPSSADEASALPPGTPVRVTAPDVSDRRLTGTLAAASEREIVLMLSSGERRTIPRSEVTRLEWSPGRRGHAIGGALIGAVLGGAFLAYASAAMCDAATCGPSMEAVLAGVGLGALPGAGIGALVRTRRWAEASPSRVQVSLVPVRASGVALSATLHF
jgi:hypothetical protein